MGNCCSGCESGKGSGNHDSGNSWTPPVSLKTIDNIVDGELADYAGYAEYLKEFLTYMKQQGAAVDVVSIQNEPGF